MGTGSREENASKQKKPDMKNSGRGAAGVCRFDQAIG
jgi:hypothetical protein